MIRLIILMFKGLGFVIGSIGSAIGGTAVGAVAVAEEIKNKE